MPQPSPIGRFSQAAPQNQRESQGTSTAGTLPTARRRLIRKRTLWPTSEGTRFLLLMFGILLAAVNTGNNLIYLLLAMLLSIIILSGILSEQSLRNVMMSRRFPRHIFAGQPFQVAIRLENRKRHFPSFSLRLREMWAQPVPEIYFPRIGPNGIATQRLTLTFRRRGRFLLSGVRLSTTFPFGLFFKTRYPSLVEEVLVYPAIRPLPPSLISGSFSLEPGQETSKGAGSLYRGLRDYRLGDDSRSIHWKTTARQRRLIVREYEAESGNRITLILANVGKGRIEGEAFEDAVRLCASLAAHWIRRGAWVRLVCAEELVPFGSGTSHLHRILKVLALTAPYDAPTQSIPSIHETAYLIQPDCRGFASSWPGPGPWRVLRAEALPDTEEEPGNGRRAGDGTFK